MSVVSENKTVKVRILEKDVQVGCAADDEDDLTRAARYVDKSMNEFRNRNNAASVEKIAIVTAINIANELLKRKGDSSTDEKLVQQLASMQTLVQGALSDSQN